MPSVARVFRLVHRGDVGSYAPTDAALSRTGVDGQDGSRAREATHAALTAFAVVAATIGEPGALDDLAARLDSTVPEADAIRDRLARMTAQSASHEKPVKDAEDAITTSRRHVPHGPRGSMVIWIRLLESARVIRAFGFDEVVGPALARWAGVE